MPSSALRRCWRGCSSSSAGSRPGNGSILLVGGRVDAGTNFNLVPAECRLHARSPDRSRRGFRRARNSAPLRCLDAARRIGARSATRAQRSRKADSRLGAAGCRSLAARALDSVAASPAIRPVSRSCPGSARNARFYTERGVPALLAYGLGILAVSLRTAQEFVKISRMVECARIYALTAAGCWREMTHEMPEIERLRCSSAVRVAIYACRSKRPASAPAAADVARRISRSRACRGRSTAYARAWTACAHVIVVLQPETTEISGRRYSFPAVRSVSRARGRTACGYAPCAWDAFGIPAAIDRDAVIDAACAVVGRADPAAASSSRPRAYGDGDHPPARAGRAFLGRHRLHLSEHPALPVGRGRRIAGAPIARASRRGALDDDPQAWELSQQAGMAPGWSLTSAA